MAKALNIHASQSGVAEDMEISYDRQTINSRNPIARFAHRSRLKKSIQITLSRLKNFTDPGALILDYGCGPGAFICELNKAIPNCAVGFEPFMKERVTGEVSIYTDIKDMKPDTRFSIITLFETIEHLSDDEADQFLVFCKARLTETGGILMSGPIEIGPALILKELNRSWLRFRAPEHGLIEFLKASLLAIPASRAPDIKSSHKGFDFRQAIKRFRDKGWSVEVLDFGPLPLKTWYGNSQFYLWLSCPPATRQ